MELLRENKYQILDNILNREEINNVLYGNGVCWKNKVSSTRVISKKWNGVTKLTDLDLQFFKFVVLPDGRVDINLPMNLVDRLLNDSLVKIQQLDPTFQIALVNLLVNVTNPSTQNWHQDNGGLGEDEYYTVLIPLVDEPGMGKTEVLVPYTKKFPRKKLKKGEVQIATPDVGVGDALIFSGSLWHRGTANYSSMPRYCLYMILTNQDPSVLFENWN